MLALLVWNSAKALATSPAQQDTKVSVLAAGVLALLVIQSVELCACQDRAAQEKSKKSQILPLMVFRIYSQMMVPLKKSKN